MTFSETLRWWVGRGHALPVPAMFRHHLRHGGQAAEWADEMMPRRWRHWDVREPIRGQADRLRLRRARSSILRRMGYRDDVIYFRRLPDLVLFRLRWSEEITAAKNASVILPILRRVMPTMIANDIIGVSPMTGPVGQIFTMRARFAEPLPPRWKRQWVWLKNMTRRVLRLETRHDRLERELEKAQREARQDRRDGQ